MLWLGRQPRTGLLAKMLGHHHRTKTRSEQHVVAFRVWLTLCRPGRQMERTRTKQASRLHRAAPSGAMLRAASFCWRCQRADVDDMPMIAFSLQDLVTFLVKDAEATMRTCARQVSCSNVLSRLGTLSGPNGPVAQQVSCCRHSVISPPTPSSVKVISPTVGKPKELIISQSHCRFCQEVAGHGPSPRSYLIVLPVTNSHPGHKASSAAAL